MPLAPAAGALRERALAKLLPQNALLAALPQDVRERLLPHLALADLRAGHELGEPGGRCARAFFPVAGVICLADAGGRVTALVGSEGAVGLPGFMSDGVLARPVVQFAGYGLALGREQLLEEWGRGGSLMRLLLRYGRALGLQISELAQCRATHSLDRQLACLLLLSLERLPAQELMLTLDDAARLLGTTASQLLGPAAALCEAGATRWRRPGLLAAHDRAALLQAACGCASRIGTGHRQGAGAESAAEAANAQPAGVADPAPRRQRCEVVAARGVAVDRSHG